MKILHGIDITKINRKEFDNQKIIERILSENEKKILLGIDDLYNRRRFVASRWAIKEAIFKAIDNKIPFNQIDIFHENNKPKVILNGYESIISISYEQDILIASIVLYFD